MQLDVQQEIDSLTKQAQMQAKEWGLTFPQFVLVVTIGSLILNIVASPKIEKMLGTR